MTTLEKAVELTAKTELELIRYGRVSKESVSKEHMLLQEAKNMVPLQAVKLSEQECIAALYIICLLSDYYGKDMTLHVLDDEKRFMDKLNRRGGDYLSISWWVGENGNSVTEFYRALQHDNREEV